VYSLFISPMHAVCPAHVILLDLTTLTIMEEEQKLCHFQHPPTSSSSSRRVFRFALKHPQTVQQTFSVLLTVFSYTRNISTNSNIGLVIYD
jgi:hypothetical protein